MEFSISVPYPKNDYIVTILLTPTRLCSIQRTLLLPRGSHISKDQTGSALPPLKIRKESLDQLPQIQVGKISSQKYGIDKFILAMKLKIHFQMNGLCPLRPKLNPPFFLFQSPTDWLGLPRKQAEILRLRQV